MNLTFDHQGADQRLRLDARQYTLGITSCGSKSLWQQACSLFAAMPAAQVARNVTRMTAVMGFRDFFMTHFIAWLQTLPENHPPQSTTSCVIYAFVPYIAALPSSGMVTCCEATEVISYNALLNSLEKGAQWHHSLRLFKSMASSNHQPDVISFCVPIQFTSIYFKKSSWIEKRLPPNPRVYHF